MKKTLPGAILGAAGILALILDGQTALQGAANGLELCLKTVIPSLFPFLFFCALLTNALWGSSVGWLRPWARQLGIPEGAEALLTAAALGGYPAGAGAVGDAFERNQLTRADAEHLLTFCSNAGPAFLFGITGIQFSSLSQIWALWCIQLLSAALTGRLAFHTTKNRTSLPAKQATISDVLMRTVKTTGSICGWILLFQILLAFGARWFFWCLPETVQVILTGLLELSSGCCALGRIGSEPVRFLVCSGLLSFGGLCVTMQTASVIGSLSLWPYLRGKLLQAGISVLLAAAWLKLGWGILWCAVLIFPWRLKKSSGFLPSSSV